MTNLRIGQGYDVHRLVQDRKLIIGGCEINYPFGLFGHSDADVLTHAIMDAILGACAMGDIGQHFPDTDSKWKGADSIEMLKEIIKKTKEAGFAVVNIDSTVIAQAPKMAPYIFSMRRNIAEACGIPVECISVKATTEEKMGFTGKYEGMAAHAVALCEKLSK